MKCIKTIKKTNSREIGEVIRINDKEAELKVKGGYWSYIPKSECKVYTGRDIKTDQVKTKKGKRNDEK